MFLLKAAKISSAMRKSLECPSSQMIPPTSNLRSPGMGEDISTATECKFIIAAAGYGFEGGSCFCWFSWACPGRNTASVSSTPWRSTPSMDTVSSLEAAVYMTLRLKVDFEVIWKCKEVRSRPYLRRVNQGGHFARSLHLIRTVKTIVCGCTVSQGPAESRQKE